MNYELRKRAALKDQPDTERFLRLANSLEEFIYRLLDPLKTNSDMCKKFGRKYLDDLLNDAIEFKQKKVALKERSSLKTSYKNYLGKLKPLILEIELCSHLKEVYALKQISVFQHLKSGLEVSLKEMEQKLFIV